MPKNANPRSDCLGLDFLTPFFAGAATGRAFAMIGFLHFASRFCHRGLLSIQWVVYSFSGHHGSQPAPEGQIGLTKHRFQYIQVLQCSKVRACLEGVTRGHFGRPGSAPLGGRPPRGEHSCWSNFPSRGPNSHALTWVKCHGAF